MAKKQTEDMVLLELCSDNIKRWYLYHLRNFIIALYEEAEATNDKELFEEIDANSITGDCLAYIMVYANQIKYTFESEDDLSSFILIEDNSYGSEEYESLCKSPEIKKFFKENRNTIIMSLFKDYMQLNYKIHCSMLETEFFWTDEYFNGEQICLDLNPYLLRFIDENDIDEDFARWFEGIFRYMNDDIDFQDDSHFQQTIKSIEEAFINDSEDGVCDSFYFSGAPFGLPASDFVASLGKTLKLVSKAKTLVSTSMALATLSNPLTCAMGVASLSIAALQSLSSNSFAQKCTLKKVLLKSYAQNYHQASLQLLKFQDKNSVELLEADAESTDPDEEWSDEALADRFVYSVILTDAFYALNVQENDLLRNYYKIDLPQELDIKRFNKLTEDLKQKDQVREYVLSFYEQSETDKKYNLLKDQSISEILRLKKIFEGIGYYSMQGYVKKFF